MLMKSAILQSMAAAAIAALAFTSCVSRQSAVRVENQRDSLSVVVGEKDSLIHLIFDDINAISENLAMIKSRENLITVAGESEGGRRPVEEINNDIAAIDRLLQENKAKIASLQRSAALLRKANLRIDGLEKMIADLNRQLADKKSEVDRLRENLAQMGLRVESLAEEVAQSSARIEDLSSEKVELQNQLHTVYYIVGSEKELRNAQIINKQGFIGRTLTVGATGNLDSFTAADSRLLAEMLEGVVTEGSGKKAYIEGYKVGGKTGTAQKYEDGKIASGKYVSSFVGFFPSDEPRYLALITVDEPQGTYYGSAVAAPVAKEIFEDIIAIKNISPFC